MSPPPLPPPPTASYRLFIEGSNLSGPLSASLSCRAACGCVRGCRAARPHKLLYQPTGTLLLRGSCCLLSFLPYFHTHRGPTHAPLLARPVSDTPTSTPPTLKQIPGHPVAPRNDWARGTSICVNKTKGGGMKIENGLRHRCMKERRWLLIQWPLSLSG